MLRRPAPGTGEVSHMTTETKVQELAATSQRSPDDMRQQVEQMSSSQDRSGRREQFTSAWYIPEWIPSADLTEMGDEIVAWLDLPGVDKKDVVIDVNRNELIIQGERRVERPDSKATRWLEERRGGKFRRTLNLHHPVKTEEIKATMEDGVLRIEMPKYPGAPVRRITVS